MSNAELPPSFARFVVLYHEMPPEAVRAHHWDFMLERGEVLATWAVEMPPEEARGAAALRLADHRRAYLEYEGPLSENRGRVSRWDEGTYEIRTWRADCIEVVLAGRRMQGTVRLARVKEEQPGGEGAAAVEGDQRIAFTFSFSALA